LLYTHQNTENEGKTKMKKMKTGKCETCGNPVSSGGNQHAKGKCPPLAGPREGSSRWNKMLARKRERSRRKKHEFIPVRGAPIAGASKKGSDKNKKKSAKPARADK